MTGRHKPGKYLLKLSIAERCSGSLGDHTRAHPPIGGIGIRKKRVDMDSLSRAEWLALSALRSDRHAVRVELASHEITATPARVELT